jgi:hypothetical protein
MKEIRKNNKSRKVLERMKVMPTVTLDRIEFDKKVFDLVLKTLYNNSQKDGLHMENEILSPQKLRLPANEAHRLWEVFISSGFVSPMIGFGNAGKLELTKAGYQLMSQYGGYSEYLTSVQNTQQQPQTIILPIQVQADEEEEQESKDIHHLPAAKEHKTTRKVMRKKAKR